MEKLVIFTDGGARGNPGPAAIGVVFYDENGREVGSHHECIGVATNNVAEYRAVIYALKMAGDKFKPNQIELNLDSELVCRQLNGQYKVKDLNLKELFYQVRDFVMESGGRVSFKHVRREQNKYADELVNRALDSK